jgi:hypothetical protein
MTTLQPPAAVELCSCFLHGSALWLAPESGNKLHVAIRPLARELFNTGKPRVDGFVSVGEAVEDASAAADCWPVEPNESSVRATSTSSRLYRANSALVWRAPADE